MPRFACPSCQQIMAATDDQRGSVITCRCGKKMRVPGTKPVTPVEIEVEVVEDSPPPRPRRSERVDETNPPPRKPSRRSRAVEADDADDAPEPPPRKKKKAPKVSVVSGFFGVLGTLVTLGLFILIVSGKWVGPVMDFLREALEERGIPPLVAVGIAAALFLLPIGLYSILSLKSTILGAMPEDLDFRQARPGDFPDLDTAKLAKWTRAFLDLGFQRLMDYTMDCEIDLGNQGFARLLHHPEQHCYAEINQAFTAGGDAIPMRCMVVGFLDDGWTVLVTNRTPGKENYLLRRPRAVWRSLPDETPEMLLQELLRLRKKMARDLDIGVDRDGSADHYFDEEKAAARERKEVIRGRSSLGIQIELWTYDRNPKHEWLGEYRPRGR